MKFLIFTCLLAIALAKHEVKHLSSSEETSIISKEKYRQDNNVVFQTSQESASSSSSEETVDVTTDKIELTEEEKIYPKQLSKINQFYQTLTLPQYLQAYRQHHILRNPQNHIKTNGYHLFPVPKSTSISQKETSEKRVDTESTEVSPEEVQLNDEEKTYLKQLVKINQYQQKFTSPHYFQAVHPQQIAMDPQNRRLTGKIIST